MINLFRNWTNPSVMVNALQGARSQYGPLGPGRNSAQSCDGGSHAPLSSAVSEACGWVATAWGSFVQDSQLPGTGNVQRKFRNWSWMVFRVFSWLGGTGWFCKRYPCGQNGFDCQSLQWVPFSTFMPPEAILGTSWQIDSKGPQTACNHLPWPRSSQSWLCCRWWMFCALISTPFRPLGTHHIRSFQMLVPVGGAQEAADTGHSSFQISQEILANLSFAAVTQLPISGSRGHLR